MVPVPGLGEVSSSVVRRLLAEGRSDEAGEVLHPDVLRYIQEHGLYRQDGR